MDRAEALDEIKRHLEIEKMQNEIIFCKREFYLKVINTALLTIGGILAFFFFQLPQVNLMKQAKLNEENIGISKIVIDVIRQNDDQSKQKKVLRSLPLIYKNNQLLNTILNEYNLLGNVDESLFTCTEINGEILNRCSRKLSST